MYGIICHIQSGSVEEISNPIFVWGIQIYLYVCIQIDKISIFVWGIQTYILEMIYLLRTRLNVTQNCKYTVM